MTTGTEPCFECTDQKGFSCDGSFVITTDYNLWLTAYTKERNQFVPPFSITSNETISIYAIKCAPQFCCQHQSGCAYLDSFNVSQQNYVYKSEFGTICAQYRDYSVPLCSRCVYGYYEIFGTTACGKCDNPVNLLWLIPMTVATALLIGFFLFNSKPIDCSIYSGKEMDDYKKMIKKDELTAMTIMIFTVIM
eukprot:140124_1